MNILVTGAKGFVGKNLCATLQAIAQGKDTSFNLPAPPTVREYDADGTPQQLAAWCAEADFVVHLAGVNRPQHEEEFRQGNCEFTQTLLNALRAAQNTCPVLFSSSVQAVLDNPYGKSKLAGERLVRDYAAQTGANVMIYRFANLFGKWCRPHYNSVVATFCHSIARGEPIRVNDPSAVLKLCYIDDAVAEIIGAMRGEPHRQGDFCTVPMTHEITLGALADRLRGFAQARKTLAVPPVGDALTAKLWATYLSYLPTDAFAYPLQPHSDERGSFTEFLRSADSGQVSVNVSHPGVTKGNHWHHTKNEKFLVVSGQAEIRFRRIDADEVITYRVSGEKPTVVDIPTGYTHSIVNIGEGDLVTLMWASECFRPEKPDTYFLEV